MDPTLQTRVLHRIKTGLPDLPAKTARAAQYIVDHPGAFGLDAIRQTSQKAGVSTYTLVALARRLGFDSFDALRAPFRHALVARQGEAEAAPHFERMRAEGPTGRVYADVAQNALGIVTASLTAQTHEKMSEITDTLLGARTVYVTGMRASFAPAYYLDYVGRLVLPQLQLIPRHVNTALDDLNDAGPDDVLIAMTVTPYSRETVAACKFALSRGVTLVLIGDSEVALPEITPHYRLAASTLSTHDFGSFLGVMAVVEVLLALLIARGGPAAQARIASYEELRSDTDAYWHAKKT